MTQMSKRLLGISFIGDSWRIGGFMFIFFGILIGLHWRVAGKLLSHPHTYTLIKVRCREDILMPPICNVVLRLPLSHVA